MKVPTWKEKQNILYDPKSNVSSEKLIAYGEACLAKGYTQDAVEYFKQAGHQMGLIQIGQTAAKEGDYFTFKQCLPAMDPQEQTTWTQTCLQQAHALGKELFASQISHAQDSNA